MKTINVKRLDSSATLPTRSHPEDAGLDFYASENVSYVPNQTFIVPTKISVSIPPGYVGLIRDRSGVATKLKLKVNAGVIDAGYIGECCIVLVNMSGEHGCILKGQKIAQMLIVPIATPEVVEVDEFNLTARGSKGFGSTDGTIQG